MKDKVTLRSDWLIAGGYSELPVEDQKDFIWRIVEEGLFERDAKSENRFLNMAVGGVVGQINKIADRTKEMETIGKKGGRPKEISEEIERAIYELKVNNPKMTAKEISAQLGISDRKVFDSTGWKSAKAYRKTENDTEFHF